MTTSQRELLLFLAEIIYKDVLSSDTTAQSIARIRIRELLAEINAGSQDIR